MNKPDLRDPLQLLAFGFGSGLAPKAPGTWGSLAGLLYFGLFLESASIGAILVATAIGVYFAVALCGEAEVRLGKKDPGEIVLDEFIVMPLCFLGWHACLAVACTLTTLLTGFALFRLFDILKPDRKSTRLNSSHNVPSRMPSSA